MLTVYWSCKGGVGTTVVAALRALRSAQQTTTLAVGLDGDLAAALGVRFGPDDPGLSDWLRAGPDVPADALARLAIDAGAGLGVVGPGAAPLPDPDDMEWAIAALEGQGPTVVLDAGRLGAHPLAASVASAATESVLVIRCCYLALRRCADLPVTPSGVIVITEPGRALTVADVESVVGAEVIADIAYDEAVARAVDAGLVTARVPRRLLAALDR